MSLSALGQSIGDVVSKGFDAGIDGAKVAVSNVLIGDQKNRQEVAEIAPATSPNAGDAVTPAGASDPKVPATAPEASSINKGNFMGMPMVAVAILGVVGLVAFSKRKR
jgi:hypothetical protein